MFNNILAIGAHPDDVELGCSGTLLKYQELGAKITIVVTRDDNAPTPSVWRNREKMQQEYRAAEQLFGTEYNILENPIDDDGRPVLEWNSRFVKQMDDIIKGGYFDLILTHSPGDHHQDHVNTYHIVNSSLRRWQGEFWLYEAAPYSNKNKIFNPNIFVDITKQMDKKIELIKCYDSYFTDTAIHNIKGLAAFRGHMTDSLYAEAFECRWRTL